MLNKLSTFLDKSEYEGALVTEAVSLLLRLQFMEDGFAWVNGLMESKNKLLRRKIEKSVSYLDYTSENRFNINVKAACWKYQLFLTTLHEVAEQNFRNISADAEYSVVRTIASRPLNHHWAAEQVVAKHSVVSDARLRLPLHDTESN